MSQHARENLVMPENPMPDDGSQVEEEQPKEGISPIVVDHTDHAAKRPIFQKEIWPVEDPKPRHLPTFRR